MSKFEGIVGDIKSFILATVADITKKSAGNKAPVPYRPMKYPYTYTAKLAQFPWKFYILNNWVFRYYLIGVVLSMPVFLYLERKSKSPANVAMWEKIKRKEKEEYENKFKYLDNLELEETPAIHETRDLDETPEPFDEDDI